MELTWDSLNIHSELKDIIKNEFKFEKMTAVQAASIPLFITNKDLTVDAVTGSGKTLAFVVPILEILLKKSKNESIKVHDVGAIVISPTRELASQIFEVFDIFAKNLTTFNFKIALSIGGYQLTKDVQHYLNNGTHIVIATPGRLFDMLEKCSIFRQRVRNCLEVFVLDEADQLLSMGFEKTLNDILAYLPKQRRTSLFSATQTRELEQLIRAGLRNPVKIEIKEKNVRPSLAGQVQMPNRLVNNYIVLKSSEDKVPFLVNFIRATKRTGKFLVFMSTCAQVDFFKKVVARFLHRSCFSKITVLRLHRKLKKQRQHIFDQFSSSEHSLLLCTDVMSRGVDIPHVDWVIHFDLPLTIENYVHRCGRSAHQANTFGNSLLLCLPHEEKFVNMAQGKGAEIQQLDEKDQVLNVQLKESILNMLKIEARRNINFYAQSVEAFVSFIRVYSSKHCMAQELFKECDIIDLANSYGLLKMPKMPELRQAKKTSTEFKGSKDDDKTVKNFKDILYHQKKNKEANNNNNGDGDDNNDSGDDSNRQQTSGRKVGPLGFKRNPELQQKINKQGKKLKGKKKREFMDNLELEELEQDARIVKKLKKGKISGQQFDQHFGL